MPAGCLLGTSKNNGKTCVFCTSTQMEDLTITIKTLPSKQTGDPLIDHPSDPWVRPLVRSNPWSDPPKPADQWSDHMQLLREPGLTYGPDQVQPKNLAPPMVDRCWTHGSTTCPGVSVLWTMVWTMCDATRQPFVPIHGLDWVLDHVSSTPSNPWSQPKLFWKCNFPVRGGKRKISCFVGKIATPQGN